MSEVEAPFARARDLGIDVVASDSAAPAQLVGDPPFIMVDERLTRAELAPHVAQELERYARLVAPSGAMSP